jgi:hypothetical protein
MLRYLDKLDRERCFGEQTMIGEDGVIKPKG